MDSLNDMTLAQLDPEIQAVLDSELGRQRETLEMIASENFVPRAVLEAQGSVLTNKYAEGYPGRRYYGGCEFVDVAESLAIERAKQVFGGDYVNVQPHAGAQANAAALMAMANVGDPILGLSLAHGGHLTHGMQPELLRASITRQSPTRSIVRPCASSPRRSVRRPSPSARSVIIAGWSAYPRHLDFAGLPRHRGRGRRRPLGGYGALRRPRRRGPAPEPRPLRRRRDDDGPQDPGRASFRHDPVLARRAAGARSSTLPCSPASRAAPSCT